MGSDKRSVAHRRIAPSIPGTGGPKRPFLDRIRGHEKSGRMPMPRGPMPRDELELDDGSSSR